MYPICGVLSSRGVLPGQTEDQGHCQLSSGVAWRTGESDCDPRRRDDGGAPGSGHVQRRGVWVIPRRPCCCLFSWLLFRVLGDLLGLVGFDESDAGLGQAVEAHVAPSDGPFVMLFGQQRSDETDDRSPGGEDPHDVGAVSDLFVQSFLGVVGPDLPPVGLGEPGEDQDLGAGLIEVVCGVAETDLVEVVCDAAVLGPYLVGVG